MSARKQSRRGSSEPAEEHHDERWMASYMDMVTVLMCMFIVLYAMSSVDVDKFEKLRMSLSTGFGTTATNYADTATGIVVPPDLIGDKGTLTATNVEGDPVDPKDLDLAKNELDGLLKIRDRIDAGLEAQGLQSTVKYEVDARGLTTRLVGAETFFDGNSDVLTPKARRVLATIGSVLASIPHQVSVEGHADPHGSSGPFPTDWELSSARATTVVRYFVDRSHVAGKRASAVGYGSTRPISTGTSVTAIAANRRVDIVIVSGAPESVRTLLPNLLNELSHPSSSATPSAPATNDAPIDQAETPPKH
ncbi:flagellar motor protein MotB [Glaciihabitans sp. dw_435]|uniref:OmpA/MotB family protein n=1 Tax=Glaciihabitans sp. dw_435 TaxID=2720081 RepID=UPI001BD68764|nr:flagellar motor protein MotB [Glaciihabitans sp. dw_435]